MQYWYISHKNSRLHEGLKGKASLRLLERGSGVKKLRYLWQPLHRQGIFVIFQEVEALCVWYVSWEFFVRPRRWRFGTTQMWDQYGQLVEQQGHAPSWRSECTYSDRETLPMRPGSAWTWTCSSILAALLCPQNPLTELLIPRRTFRLCLTHVHFWKPPLPHTGGRFRAMRKDQFSQLLRIVVRRRWSKTHSKWPSMVGILKTTKQVLP